MGFYLWRLLCLNVVHDAAQSKAQMEEGKSEIGDAQRIWVRKLILINSTDETTDSESNTPDEIPSALSIANTLYKSDDLSIDLDDDDDGETQACKPYNSSTCKLSI